MIELAGSTRLRPTPRGRSTFTLEQRVRYEYDRPVTNLRQRLMLVPRGRHGGQRRLTWTLALEGARAATARHGRDRFGNHVIEVALPRVDGHVEFVVHSVVEQRVGEDGHRDRLHPGYRRATRLTADHESIGALVGHPAERPSAEEICGRVHAVLAYEWGVTGVRTSAAEALAGGRGVCQDYAHLMVAACRRHGIAARYVSGHLRGEGGSHAWVEVLEPDGDGRTGTVVAWDPTHDRRVESGYLTVAVGRDYSDVSPLSGTFDACRPTQSRLTVTKVFAAA